MSLQKSNVDILLTNGINSKTDSKLTLNNNLIALENGVFTKIGAIDKRYGYSKINTNDTSDSALSGLRSLATFGNELLASTESKLFAYSQVTGKWSEKGELASVNTNEVKLIANTYQQSNFDSCFKNGLFLYVWEDTRGGLRYSVKDETSDSYLVFDAVLDASGAKPRCVNLGNNLICIYGQSTNLKAKYVAIGDPTALVSTTIATDLNSGHIFDVTKVNNVNAFVFYKSSTATTAVLRKIGNLATSLSTQSLSYTVDDVVAITHSNYNNITYLGLFWKESASLIKTSVYTSAYVNTVATATLDSTSSTDIVKMAACGIDDTFTCFYQVPAVSRRNDYLRKNTVNLAGTVGTSAVFVRSLGLASKPFIYNDNIYINCLHESDLQATVFTLNSNGRVIATLSNGNAGTHDASVNLPQVTNYVDNVYGFPMNFKGPIRTENNTIYSNLQLIKSEVTFNPDVTLLHSELNNNLHIAGGMLYAYDGASLTEHGFHLFPEGLSLAQSASGGSMSNGTYAVAVVYSWVDAKGNRHQSIPDFESITLTGGGSSQKITSTIPTLRISRKSNVVIDVYRTVASGSIYYQVTSISSPTFNDSSVDTITYDLTAADASITSNAILYTVGGVLDNAPAPSCDLVVSHKNRLYVSGFGNGNEVRYSKIVRDGEGIAFNEGLSLVVNKDGGQVTQLASMDNNLIIFKRDNIYLVSGDGPSDTGSGSTFTEPQLIVGDVGCVDSKSVVLSAQGLYFKSAKGIYLLDRSLNATYVGDKVERYNSSTITSARLLDDVNEIRFTTAEGVTLVFNYYFNQWSTFTNQKVLDSVIFNNKFTYLNDSDTVLQEDSSKFLDDLATYKMVIETGWLRLSGLQDFQRVYRMMLLGQYQSNHTLRMTFYSDYSSVANQIANIDTASVLATNYFGGGATYGSTSPYGGSSNGVYQFQVHLTEQKCQAIRVRIEDIIDNSQDYDSGQSYSITGLSFQVGLKQGQNKIDRNNKGA